MSNITTGNVESAEMVFNGLQPTIQVMLNGDSIDGYDNNYPVITSLGLYSLPVLGAGAVVTLSPYATTGYISGFMNESPEEDNNINELKPGETAICETKNFNFSLQAKLDGLKSIFLNNDKEKITTNLLINENVVTILTDIIAEIQALETAYNNFINFFNNHTHNPGSYVAPNGAISGNSGKILNDATKYNPTSNYDRDKDFLNNSPSQMYININGKVVK